MPFFCSDYQKRFRWELTPDGVPVADVITLGGVLYTASCPLCGCLHELPRGTADGQVIEPRCLLREFASSAPGVRVYGAHSGWITRYGEWLVKYPDAAQHARISVKIVPVGAHAQAPGGEAQQQAPRRRRRAKAKREAAA